MNSRNQIAAKPARGAMWLAYGTILTGVAAFAGMPAAIVPGTDPGEFAKGPILRFERSKAFGSSITLGEQHSLEMRGLVLERGDEEPKESEVSLHIWSGTLALIADEIDPATGLLCRRYDRSKGAIQSGRIDESGQEFRGPELPLVSPLEDVGVAFVPSANAPGGYARHYDSAKTLRETILPRLAAPRDWNALLPPPGADGQRGPTELGAQWDIDPSAMVTAFSPTGDLLFTGGEGMDPRMLRSFTNGVGGNLHLGFAGEADGTAKGRFLLQGVDPDHGSFADIEVDFDISVSADRAAFIKDNPAEAISSLDGELLAADLEQTFRGTTKLRWSLDTNQPISCVTECDEVIVMAVQMKGLDGIPVRQTVSLDGDMSVSIKFDEVRLRGSARGQ